MNKKKPQMKNIKIYCAEVERTINPEGCYDSKGSYDCKICSEKPAPKKADAINKDNKR
jgi:hypothetical protein